MTSKPDPDSPDPETPDSGSSEDLLARILTGELSLEDPTVQAAMAANHEFARDVMELLDLSDELIGSQAANDTGASHLDQTPEPWLGADRAISEIVRTEFERDQPSTRARSAWRWPVLALVAASLAVAAWLGWHDPLPVADPNRILGPGQLAPDQLWPNGDTARADFAKHGFCWGDLKSPPGATLTLIIEVDGQPIGEPIVVTGLTEYPVPAFFDYEHVDAFHWQLRSKPLGRRATSLVCDVAFQ